jgi:hypothetical protein
VTIGADSESVGSSVLTVSELSANNVNEVHGGRRRYLMTTGDTRAGQRSLAWKSDEGRSPIGLRSMALESGAKWDECRSGGGRSGGGVCEPVSCDGNAGGWRPDG